MMTLDSVLNICKHNVINYETLKDVCYLKIQNEILS